MVGGIALVRRGVLEEDMERDNVTVHESKNVKLRIEEVEQLLPGIPNDLTFDHVAPKLPWSAFHTLSLVSHGWQRAIQGHHVYDARVCSKSTQMLVAMENRYSRERLSRLLIYSVKDGSSYHLPPIPGLQRIPPNSKCISLDGKLYVLGGFQESTVALASAKVYVLDVAGRRQWKQCASMAFPRAQFGCGVFDGKIYVFGGTDKPLPGLLSDLCLPVCGSEVYDPKEDAWCPITPTTSFRSRQKVVTVGEELFVYNGLVYAPDFLEQAHKRVIGRYGMSQYENMAILHSGEVYHPVKDEWRTLEPFFNRRIYSKHQSEQFLLVMVGGEPHMVNSCGLHFYDKHDNSWNLLQEFSFDEIGPRSTHRVEPFAAVAVDDVLLVDVSWTCLDHTKDLMRDSLIRDNGQCRMMSHGLSGEKEELVFRKIQWPHSEFMCPIQL